MSKQAGTATLVKILVGEWRGNGSLYRVSPPLSGNDYVIVYTVWTMFDGPETHIAASNELGAIVDGFIDLVEKSPGGGHRQALSNAGYEINQ